MSIKNWPETERPREKLLSQGARSLSDAELVALFINTGIRGKSALDIGRELLAKFGNLNKLIGASLNEWCQIPGLGPAKYVLFQAAIEISRRNLFFAIHQQSLPQLDPLQIHHYLQTQFNHYQQEVFGCFFLNNIHEILCFEELFHGTINCAEVYPREVVKRALYHNAAAVIFAHNHPSGSASPSAADIAITQRLQQSLKSVEVQVLDHFIVSKLNVNSMASLGLIG